MPKSFILKEIFIPALFLFVSTILILAGCSKSDDQKEFENEAFNIPNEITATDASGSINENGNDPDDWRISPNYAGLVRVEKPAYPNPVVGDRFSIEIYIAGIDAIPSNRMEFFILDSFGQEYQLPYVEENLTTGLITITLSRNLIAEISPNQSSNLYRILISDGRNNIISYGDVQIGQLGTP